MNTRNYFVPRAVSNAAPVTVLEPLVDTAVRAARRGSVRGYHLPVLASCGWKAGADWAGSILEKENASRGRQAEALLAAVGYDPETYHYYGVLDPGYPDQELICSVARDIGDTSQLEKWDGLDWGRAEIDPDGLEFVMLDEDVLIDVLQAIQSGSSGLMLRPFNPKAWTRGVHPTEYPIVSAGKPPKHTGVMVAFYPDEEVAEALAVKGGEPVEDIHLTLVYLGDTQEKPIDYQRLQRAVAKWARRMSPIAGEIAGTGLFTAGEKPVTYASVDCPDLPEARQMLVRILESEGLSTAKDHGYTPHMTIAYKDVDVDVENHPLKFDRVVVQYGDDTQIYDLGLPAVAAGGAGPDMIYAIVDEFDTSAVLDLLRVVPGPIAYRRSAGKWVKDQKALSRLMGVDPPPVVTVPAEQVETVLAQVDAYDKENPEDDEEAVTAAVPWDEKKFKRGQGGKFATKNGGQSTAGRRPVHTPGLKGPGTPGTGPQGGRPVVKGPGKGGRGVRRDLTDRDVGLGRRRPRGGREGGRGPGPREIRNEPWKLLGPGGNLRAGLRDEFWKKQPAGFHDWLERFLAREGQPGRPTTSSSSNDDDKDDRTGAQKKADKKVQKRNKEENARDSSAQSERAKGGRPSWWAHVPPQYRAAMRAFLSAAADKAREDQARPKMKADRVRRLAKADRDFELKFAKEGLGESRRRESFDRGIADQARRLGDAGLDPQAIASVMKQKVLEEKRRRENFERQRRLKAEQERVRRIQQRNAEADQDAEDERAMTAAITAMPPQLIEYWVHGEGAAKVGWGTDGSYTRALRFLSEAGVPRHMVHGAAANLYHLATGRWPGPQRGRSLTAASRMPAKLKKYWLGSEGAAKIRWGTGGDFGRCERNLGKYLPAHQVKGACANLHKLATGQWPGKGREH